MSVQVRFFPDDVLVEAEPGEAVLDVAERAGLFIPTGCMMGSCHACEVELGDGTPICSCITAIPDQQTLTINLLDDMIW
ncbi:MAG: (2Fe-2S)-binding protein [Cyanobacteria bacterium SW_9_44_58]|nr:MAG: (2Fe-2S)-binding protein [Cyanobacteria bacterium SW_9_44_58]